MELPFTNKYSQQPKPGRCKIGEKLPELSAAAALPEISPELHQFTLQPCSSRPRASASHIVVPPARSATTDKGLAARVVVCRRRGLLLELTWTHPAKTTRVGPSGGRDEGCACGWGGGRDRTAAAPEGAPPTSAT